MKTTSSFRLLTLVGALTFILSAPVGRASLLVDWDLLEWAPGALTQTFTIGPGEVTIAISGDTGSFNGGGSIYPSTPRLVPLVPNTFTGGIPGPGNSALQNLLTFADNTKSITYMVSFNYAGGVDNVAFSLFDIDAGVADINQPIDQVRNNVATLVGGGTVGPSSLTPSIDNTVTGVGISQVVTGMTPSVNTTANGNANYQYNGNALNQFVFTFGNDAAAFGTGLSQGFALSDISFTPVPEAGTVAACAVFSLLGAWGLRRMRRGQVETVES